MYAIAFFGILMILLSSVMVIDPDNFSNKIVKFSQTKYFHKIEIIIRLFFGAIFIELSEQTLYPAVMSIFGFLMVAAGVRLLLTGSSRHKQFAVWSAKKFNKAFRPAGVVSIAFGVFIVYAAGI